MNNKDILGILADAECKLFYAKCQEPENEVLTQLHKAVKELMIDFHEKTGATL